MQAKIIGEPVLPELSFKTLDDYYPENPECFCLTVEITIGAKGKEGADNFMFDVCNAEWLGQLAEKNKKGVYLKNIMLVHEYDALKIKNRINELVSSTSATCWKQYVAKITKWIKWEFEN